MSSEAVPGPEWTFTAGPVAISDRVRRAMSGQVIYHYDPAFLKLVQRTEGKVADVFATGHHEILLLPYEALGGLEAAARSLVHPGMPVLNINSGVFGAGMGEWLQRLGAEVYQIEAPYNSAVNPADVAARLDEHPDIVLVCVVDCETPSGTRNDCSQIGPIARARGVLTLVNCVSSLGGMPFSPDVWELDVCVAGPQKCLGGPSGLSLAAVSDAAGNAMESNPAAPHGWLLSLLDMRDLWHGRERFPCTPPVTDMYGLEAACDEWLERGRYESFARIAKAARICRAGIRAMGLQLWPVSEAVAASCVTAVAIPEGISHQEVQQLARKRGVMVSGSQGAGNLIRIGHMGAAADYDQEIALRGPWRRAHRSRCLC